MPVVSISIESNLIKRFDKVWESEGYHNRSEALRSAMREFIYNYENQVKSDTEIVESIVAFTFHDSKKIRLKLEDIQHSYREVIREKSHRHVVEDICFEMFTLRGETETINSMIVFLKAIKNIETFHTFFISLSDHNH